MVAGELNTGVPGTTPLAALRNVTVKVEALKGWPRVMEEAVALCKIGVALPTRRST